MTERPSVLRPRSHGMMTPSRRFETDLGATPFLIFGSRELGTVQE